MGIENMPPELVDLIRLVAADGPPARQPSSPALELEVDEWLNQWIEGRTILFPERIHWILFRRCSAAAMLLNEYASSGNRIPSSVARSVVLRELLVTQAADLVRMLEESEANQN